MKHQRLMRITYNTDANDGDPDYWGAFSAPFPKRDEMQIVGVDWSTRGEVVVTYLIPV